MNFIRHIIEPKRLLLAWQAANGDRTRRLVGELTRTEDNVELRYLEDSKDFHEAVKNGFVGYQAFPRAKRVYTKGVVEAFIRRLPPRSRPDFNKYLESLRIPADTRISDFALLGYSGARLPSDWFALVHPFDDAKGPCEFLTEVAGFRYYEGMNMNLSTGIEVSLKPEPENPYDPMAIMVLINDKRIGYIGRGQLEAFQKWLQGNIINAVIEKISGPFERPIVMLFVTISPPVKKRL